MIWSTSQTVEPGQSITTIGYDIVKTGCNQNLSLTQGLPQELYGLLMKIIVLYELWTATDNSGNYNYRISATAGN